ncbi:transposase [Providencia stuartii]|uniref:Transposase n=1 Tax=Providencia stuartii TaxID=588 RepID=A0A1S1HJY0_PROST|nr:transposase [Providencia stuartii]
MALVSVKCRFCGLTAPVKKHGTGNGGHPRYRCQTCSRTFQLDYIYRACQPGIKEQVVELAINNAGIRDTARALHISINAVIRTLKNSTLGR